MKVITTPGEALERGYWIGLCKILGINVYAIRENRILDNEEIELTEEQAQSLGILPRRESRQPHEHDWQPNNGFMICTTCLAER